MTRRVLVVADLASAAPATAIASAAFAGCGGGGARVSGAGGAAVTRTAERVTTVEVVRSAAGGGAFDAPASRPAS